MAYNTLAGIGTVITSNQTDNPCNILTMDNIIMLCGDVGLTDYTADDVILTLSYPSMRPSSDIVFPVCVSEVSTVRTAPCTLHTDGTITLPFSYTSAIVHFNGLCLHVNDSYYTPSIGNIYDNGSSPLDAR